MAEKSALGVVIVATVSVIGACSPTTGGSGDTEVDVAETDSGERRDVTDAAGDADAVSDSGAARDGDAAREAVGDSGSDCELGTTADGGCREPLPQGTAPEHCASGKYAGSDAFRGKGICLPELRDWECPEGWLSTPGFVDEQGESDVPEGMEQFRYCEPPPLPDDCPAGEMPVLGKKTCQSIGLECPSGDKRFHDEQTIRSRTDDHDGEIVYADSQAQSRGDGSRDKPYRTLYRALREANARDIVALAPASFGRFVDRRLWAVNEIREPTALVGSCPAQTVIEPPESPGVLDHSAVYLLMSSGPTTVSDLQIDGTGDEMSGIQVDTNKGEPVTLRSFHLKQANGRGIVQKGKGALELRNGYIEQTTSTGRTNGFGILMTNEGSFRNVTLEGNQGTGVQARGESRLTAVDFVVRDSEPLGNAYGEWGAGIVLRNGARATLRRTLLDHNHGFGLLVDNSNRGNWGGLTANVREATDLVVRATQPAQNGKYGYGIQIQTRARLERLRRTVLEKNHGVGLFAVSEETRVGEISGLVVQGTQYNGNTGHGLAIHRSAKLGTLKRAVLSRNQGLGIGVGGGSLGNVSDLVIHETQSSPAPEMPGIGVNVWDGSSGSFSSVLIEGSHGQGIRLKRGAGIEVTRGVIRETGSRESKSDWGDGIYSFGSSSLRLDEGLVTENVRNGMVFSRAENSRVENTAITKNNVGLTKQRENDVEFVHSRVAGNEQEDTRCERQCFEEPSEPEKLDPVESEK